MSRKRRTVADEPYLLVRTSTSDHGDSAAIAGHRHSWHQLIHVRSGLMIVRTAAGSWIAPPTWAIWVPAGVSHAIRFVGDSALRTAYVRPDWHPARPGEHGPTGVPGVCMSLGVSPLLAELLVRATTIGMLDGRDPAEAAIATLIVAELGEPRRPPFALPEPTSPATVEATRLIAAEAASAAGTATLARAVGVGTRSLERRFLAETGMTLGRWRQQRNLLRGLEHVAAGATTTAAAAAAGYRSPSAFIAAFRKAFDATPARYF
jgi:AraC-like DNA-binding protein